MFEVPVTGSGLSSPIVGRAVAVHPTTGQMWIALTSNGASRLGVLTLDMANARANVTSIVVPSQVIQAMAFDHTGVLWAVANDNLDTRGLPKMATGNEMPTASRLYTVNTGTGAVTFRTNLTAPAFRGAGPYDTNVFTGTRFLTDRETLVFDPVQRQLFRFASGLQAINISTLAVTNTALTAPAGKPNEPRTIWGAVWGWPTANTIGITAPNLVYSLYEKFPNFYSVTRAGVVNQAFEAAILVEASSMALADLGQAFKDRLWTDAECATSAACVAVDDCLSGANASCWGIGDVQNGGWMMWNPDASCKGRPGCAVWPDDCSRTATCGFAQCRGVTSCIGGL
jgi:hypothetical protein